MNVKVLKKTSNELKIEIDGAGHTLCNLIQRRLVEDETTDLAGYEIPHPLASNPIIYIRTKDGVKPETTLRKAAESARDMNKEFSKELDKALKKA